jgi:type IV pilus assembly protein PilB
MTEYHPTPRAAPPPPKVIDLRRVVASPEAIRKISGPQARRLGVLPITIDHDRLQVVLADDDNALAVHQLEAQVGMPIQVLRAQDPPSVAAMIRRYYPQAGSDTVGTPLGLFEEIVQRAILCRSSDIHLDPESDGGRVRLRIDGMLRVDRQMPLASMGELISAIKVAARLDIAERRVPQDGQVSLRLGNDEISMRVATVPTIRGEKMTLRILPTESLVAELAELDALGMSDEHHQLLLSALDQAHGIILLSGPTGSGKTTTLYAALRHLRRPGTSHILSIEDPVEIPLEGINQVHVDAERVSFNGALRSALRHDPDIIMIGEIRDAETADIAVKSALTGHLVLSTLHANDSASVVTRLLNLGVAPELVTSALRLVIAQRLVRQPCPHCVRWAAPSETDREWFGWESDESLRVPQAVGCPLCNGTGYAGRTGLYEMIPLQREVRELIRERAGEDRITARVFGDLGLATLRQDGARKVRQGGTTCEEVRRVTYMGEEG